MKFIENLDTGITQLVVTFGLSFFALTTLTSLTPITLSTPIALFIGVIAMILPTSIALYIFIKKNNRALSKSELKQASFLCIVMIHIIRSPKLYYVYTQLPSDGMTMTYMSYIFITAIGGACIAFFMQYYLFKFLGKLIYKKLKTETTQQY